MKWSNGSFIAWQKNKKSEASVQIYKWSQTRKDCLSRVEHASRQCQPLNGEMKAKLSRRTHSPKLYLRQLNIMITHCTSKGFLPVKSTSLA